MTLNANEPLGCHYILHCMTINFVLKERKQILQIGEGFFLPLNPYDHWIFEFQSQDERISFIMRQRCKTLMMVGGSRMPNSPIMLLRISLKNWLTGAWVAQSVKHPAWAQVMISQYMSSSPASGSLLSAQILLWILYPHSDPLSVLSLLILSEIINKLF